MMKHKNLGILVLGAVLSYAPMSEARLETDASPVPDKVEYSVIDETSHPVAGWYEDGKKLWRYTKRYGKDGVDEFCNDFPRKCRWARKNYRKVKKVFK